ncbi:KH domain-containing protein [Waterburya agarophytonicola K14]|uniref:KH domain-containing protein n=1 Tax=Waterburya agarophytonicola KI4 TaxID=2874699 RepID=A0A964BPG0_9CYAN|nr:KH domain-containing protein [Waterburya agarophytonicola]MCC0177183.1 KH domain-containing protein [Waterburya agarophytonicola KI4]
MPNKTQLSGDQVADRPNYEELVRFLIEPFLNDPQSLCVHSEVNQNQNKIWLRVAFDKSDRGKVFGRGGRNIQAIRTAIQTAAISHNESVFLDIYSDEPPKSDDGDRRGRSSGNSGNSQRRKSPAKPAPKIAKK